MLARPLSPRSVGVRPRGRARLGTLRPSAAVLALGLTTATLASCSSAAVLEPAPSASDPVCAQVLQALPGELGGATQRETTSQASAAWGDPPITLRCGVTPLGPTTDPCWAVTGPGDTSVDWVVKEYDDVVDPTDPDAAQQQAEIGNGRFVFTTYGRVPAIEVVVPVEYAGTDATAILIDLGSAVSRTDAQRSCY
ncbi:MAG TPA: DUF3515 domain-containing protein [Micrococcales bacterium]|uniref:DUF3515 family protein n=1 Tax=Miniimonas arenae TaxID=676201 RepID=UPI000EC1C5BB|nr:DUF3515 family protein [Miniimonas arenae]HCX84035.1 DUF3515 domain-containing protein [Micrococcales bacterium]